MNDTTNNDTDSLYGKFPPRVPLRIAITYTDELVKTSGATGSKDDLSKALSTSNTTSGAYRTRVANLRYLGIIETDKVGYRLEPLGAHITSGVESIRREAIKKAFLNIPTVRKIWEIYKGGIMPSRPALGNNLVVRLPNDVPKEYKDEWAKYFFEGAEYADLLDRRANGFYLKEKEPNPDDLSGLPSIDMAKTKSTELARIPNAPSIQTFFSSPSDTLNFSKVLSSERILTITIPEDPTPQEAGEIVQRMKQAIKAMKGYMEDDEQ